MKLLSTAKRNLINLSSPELRVKFALRQLIGATLPNPKPSVITAKVDAKAAIIGTGTAANPQFPAVAAKPAVMSPVVNPLPTWINCINVDKSNANYDKYSIPLPFDAAVRGKGGELDVKAIGEITAPNFDLGDWIGAIAPTVGTEEDFMVGGLPGTTEQYLYTNALLLTAVAGTTNVLDRVTIFKPSPTVSIPVVLLEIYLGK